MDEAVSLVDSLAASKAREAPLPLRRSADLRCRRRWMRMLTMSFSRSFAMFFVSVAAVSWSGTEGSTPDLARCCGR